MLKNFLIICICVCCVVAVFALPHRFTYDGLQTAIAMIGDESSMVRDDFNTISLMSYYWNDRLSINYSAGDRIGFARGDGSEVPATTIVYWFYNINTTDLEDPSTYYRYEVFEYENVETAAFAEALFNKLFEYSTVIDWASADNILENVALGIVSLVHSIGLVVALAITFAYFFFDIFGVSISVLRAGLWLLGFI